MKMWFFIKNWKDRISAKIHVREKESPLTMSEIKLVSSYFRWVLMFHKVLTCIDPWCALYSVLNIVGFLGFSVPIALVEKAWTTTLIFFSKNRFPRDFSIQNKQYFGNHFLYFDSIGSTSHNFQLPRERRKQPWLQLGGLQLSGNFGALGFS